MQVIVEIPDHIARALPTPGESVEQSVVRAAAAMVEKQALELRRRRAVDDILASRAQLKPELSLDELLGWKAQGRR